MSVLVTHLAPDFTKPAVLPNGTFNDTFNFHTEIAGKYAVLFFYPLDFTFVCPSEIIAHSHRAEEFRKRNVEVIGVSVDSQFTHYAWRNTPIDSCLLYTSDAADERSSVDLGGRRIIKKKKP